MALGGVALGQGNRPGPALADPDLARARSTAPAPTRREEEFNLAFLALGWDQQVYVLALLARHDQPWLTGESWESFFRWIGLARKDFEKLLGDALRSLSAAARRRGLA